MPSPSSKDGPGPSAALSWPSCIESRGAGMRQPRLKAKSADTYHKPIANFRPSRFFGPSGKIGPQSESSTPGFGVLGIFARLDTMLPSIPPEGFRGPQKVALLPGARLIPAEFASAGRDLNFVVYRQITNRWNIFQIPLR